MSDKISKLNSPMDLHKNRESHPNNMLDSMERVSNNGDVHYLGRYIDLKEVKRLEDRLGEPLIERTKKRRPVFPLRLTEAGQALLAKIKQWKA